jgi:two-component system, NtrC family, nitrogen regulation sensor histidine kinase NtrY
MAVTIRPDATSSSPARPPVRRAPGGSSGRRPLGPGAGRRRPPFRDNPRLILLAILLLLAALAGTLTFANRSARLSPDFLIDFVLYAVSVADLTMLVGLLFVLARNLVKLLVERRRGLPFARFRAKLVAVLLGMTLIPSVLVLFVGSELIRNSVEQWFNAPLEEILTSANQLASDYHQERQRVVNERATQIAAALAATDLSAPDVSALRGVLAPEVTQQRGVDLVEVYRVVRPRGSERPEVAAVVAVQSSALPGGYNRASADRRALRVALGVAEAIEKPEPLEGGAELIRAAAAIRDRQGQVSGVVVVSTYLSGALAKRSQQMASAYQRYAQTKVLQGPLTGVYLSFFLMMTLMILVGATWIGLYMAKRITRPIRALNAAAREIGAGHLDHRVEAETADEFGSLVEAFNAMAAELAASRRKLERSAIDLQRKHEEVEERRRYIETILERIATGVISVDGHGRIGTVNAAASRLLGLDDSVIGQPAATVFGRPDLAALGTLLERARKESGDTQAQEVALLREGRDIHLAAVATTLHADAGAPEARVLVFDDITPLIRAQKVAAWREVARRLAHEVKNPLTPIQLSAERLRRHFANAPAPAHALVEECSTTIITEVESLKGLVDEFSQFARMPPPKRVPTDLQELARATVALYNGLFQEVTIECRFADALPPVNVDPEQIRRVVINLVDNAIEAMDRRGGVTIETVHDESAHVARLVIADNGPGIPPSEREKLFLPYYSTKRRGSGLGLAIVRRIVLEHGGTVDVGDNVPRGTRFTIELPC